MEVGNKLASNTPLQEYADVESSTADYAARFAGPAGRYLLEVQSRVFLEHIQSLQNDKQLPPNFTILDIGGGHGQIVSALHEANLPVSITVRGSTEECGILLNDLRQSSNCNFEYGDLCNTGHPNNAFDVVTCFRLLPHCSQWPALIEEMCRVSRYGVIVDYPPILSSNIMYPILFGLKKRLEGNTREFKLFTHKEVRDVFFKYGLVNRKREGQLAAPMVLHRILKTPTVSRLIEEVFRTSQITHWLGNPTVATFVRSTARIN